MLEYLVRPLPVHEQPADLLVRRNVIAGWRDRETEAETEREDNDG